MSKAPAAGLGKPGVTVLTSATVSRLADQAASIALVLVIIARTHDPRLAGLVVAAFTIPTLVTGPVLGAYLDRLRAKRALFVSNQLLLAAALTGILLLAGRTTGLVLIGLGLSAGLTAPVLTGGFSSLVPLVVPPAGLPRANALDSASYNVAGLGGPALVAAVASAAGAPVALSVVAGTAAGGVLLVLAAPMPATHADAHRAHAGTLRAEVADGLGLLRAIPLLRATTIATTAAQFTQGLLPVTLPLLAIRLGHTASGGGWLLTAISAGGLIGALASDRLLARRTPRAVLIASMGVFAACLGIVALAPDFWLAVCVSALAGVAEGPILAATLTVRQQCVPPARYAQTVATAASLKTGSFALGAAATGLLAGALNARDLMLIVAVGQLLALWPLLPRRAGLAEPRPLPL